MPLNVKIKELDAEKTRLATEPEAAPDEKPLLHPALAVNFRDRVAALAKAHYDEREGRQAFERLRSVIEEVRLTPVDGQLAIELLGDLAELLNVGAASAQSAETAKKNALQIKMVAGARLSFCSHGRRSSFAREPYGGVIRNVIRINCFETRGLSFTKFDADPAKLQSLVRPFSNVFRA